MSTITKEQWQQIEEELKGMACSVTFQFKGHELLVRRVPTKEGRWDLVVYTDKQVHFGWGWPSMDTYNPLVETIWRRRSRALYSPTKKKKLIKEIGKRLAKKYFPKLEEKQIWYDATFTSAASLVRQYRKIDGLEVVSIGYQENQVLKDSLEAIEQNLAD